MSLDVYLETPGQYHPRESSGIFIREGGKTVELSREEWDRRFPGREPVVAPVTEEGEQVYWRNITHNLGKMASAAGIYEHLWRPEEIGITKAKQLIAPLADGLTRLSDDPEKFKALNPSNGWGDYDGLVAFVKDYLAACIANPESEIRVSR